MLSRSWVITPRNSPIRTLLYRPPARSSSSGSSSSGSSRPRAWPIQKPEPRPCCRHIQLCAVEPRLPRRHAHQDVRVGSKLGDKHAKVAPHLVLKLGELLGVARRARELAAGVLPRLEDIRHALEAVAIGVLIPLVGGPL